MVQWWRLTRNRYGRAAYDALARIGVTATQLYEYRRSLAAPPDVEELPGEVTVGSDDPRAVASLGAPIEELVEDEEVVVANDATGPVGYLFCSIDATHEIHPLEERMTFEGAYVRRVWVDPEHRNRGIAGALLARACRRAADRGASEATALVALDNRPSRALFRGAGFDPVAKHRYVRVGPLSHRSTESC